MAGCASLPEPDLAPPAPAFKIVTYNVNWGCPYPGRVMRFLSQTDADLICLQETHRQWERDLKKELQALYPYSTFHDSYGAGGIAFMSKHPLKDVRVLPPEAGWFPALLVTVETDLGSLQVLNVHLKPPLNENGKVSVSALYTSSDIHHQELSRFHEETDPDLPLIIAGDFNENEDSAAIQKLLGEGYADALSMYDKKSHTWKWQQPSGFTLKNRYDHILFNDYFHCTGAKVVEVDASDHLPVVATLVKKIR